MGAALKVLVGLILVIIGLGLFVDDIYPIVGLGINWISNLFIVITGIIPLLLILLGLFVMWLEIDELKAQKEINKEEKKEKKEDKK